MKRIIAAFRATDREFWLGILAAHIMWLAFFTGQLISQLLGFPQFIIESWS